MRTHIRHKRLWIVLIGLICAVVVGYMTSRVNAQGKSKGNSGNPSILAVVREIQSAVASLSDAVNELETKVDALGTTVESNVRASAPTFAAGGIGAVALACPVSNVSNQTRTIHVQLFTGGQLAEEGTVTLSAGAAGQTVIGSGQGNLAYCTFTVQDGTRQDIRGAMTIGSGFTVALVVPAD